MDPAVLAAVIAAVVALIAIVGTMLGVVATVIGTVWVAHRQLSHDRAERTKDRVQHSKREHVISGLVAANEAIRAVGLLVREDVDTDQASATFNSSIAQLNAASAVASIEVVERGRDLVGAMGAAFLLAMRERARALQSDDQSARIEFGFWMIDHQLQLMKPYGLLVAAVRRDLEIAGNTDEKVLAAVTVDAAALKKALGEAVGWIPEERGWRPAATA